MNKMIHYSETPIDKLDLTWDYFDPMLIRINQWGKPNGLWVSIEDGRGWLDWCKEASFRLDHLTYKYEVKLHRGAKILRLKNHQDLYEFTEKYWCDPLSEVASLYKIPLSENLSKHLQENPPRIAIRWEAVIAKYQGIIISPLISSPLSSTQWYYGWDCSSGCIWDISAIKEFKLICSEPVEGEREDPEFDLCSMIGGLSAELT